MVRGSKKTHNRAKRAPGGLGGPTGRGIREKAQRKTLEEAPLDMPKGVMKQSAETIARAAKDAAERVTGRDTPSPYRAAMTWLTEQAERESKTAKPERRKMFERAKDILRSLFGMTNQNAKGAGGVKGAPRSKRTKRRRRSTAART